METTPRSSSSRMSGSARALAVAAALTLGAVLLLPVWNINLVAPQYPEGLGLTIWMSDITGQEPHDLGKINNLNHYIGMKAIHPEEIPELIVMPIVLMVLAGLALIAAATGRRSLMVVWVVGVILFGVVGMADFYRWGYDYGHSLDPSAPIKVPGMSYQPPLIGSKKLLNFTAESIPSFGAYLAFVSFFFGVLSTLWDTKIKARGRLSSAFLAVLLIGCGSREPREIRAGVDKCTECHMMISDVRFAAQIVTTKGKPILFDSTDCLQKHLSKEQVDGQIWIADFVTNAFHRVEESWLVKGSSMRGPMGGDIVAFKEKKGAESFMRSAGGSLTDWGSIKNSVN